jgi:hypothetical protein
LRLLAASKLCATLLGTILAAALALPARAEPKKIEWKGRCGELRFGQHELAGAE